MDHKKSNVRKVSKSEFDIHKIRDIDLAPLPKPVLNILDKGCIGYQDALDLQRNLYQKRLDGQISDTILLLEHAPVITLGARQTANHVIDSPDRLARQGIDLIQTRRGGGTTVHNPGQLVIYVICHLKERHLGVSECVRLLERSAIALLKELQVAAHTKKGYPGVWTGAGKIASVGLRIRHWVTTHGMAINISNDLRLFDCIIPCGLENVRMTSVAQETGRHHSMSSVKSTARKILQRLFGSAERTSLQLDENTKETP